MDRVRRGAGRVQFLAHKREIARRLEAGETGRLIYEELSGGDDPKLTLSYRQFMKYIEKEFDQTKQHKREAPKKAKTSPPETGEKKGGIKRFDYGEAEHSFQHQPKADDDELI